MNLNKLLENQKELFRSDITTQKKFKIIHLLKLKKALIKNEQRIYSALFEDLNKSKEEAYLSEFSQCIKEINYFLRKIGKLSRPKKVRTSLINFKSNGYVHKVPFGSCLIISTWNYPFFLSLIPLIGCIASGNTCILKLHPFSKHSNEVIHDILKDAFESNYVKSIDGDEDILDELLDLDFDHIFATGSESLGKKVYKKSSDKLIKVTLELGGKNPCIVHNDSNIKIACKRIAYGKLLNSGQTCLAPDILYVHSKIKDEFINTLIKTIKDMYSEDPMSFKHTSKIINENSFNRLIDIINNYKENILFGGDYNKNTLRISPTIIDEGEIISQEIFGPIFQIKSYNLLDGLINKLKNSPPPLALYLFTENKVIISKFLSVPFGGGCINDTLLHITEGGFPFGGIKNSGIGNYRGKYSFDTFTHKKSILMKSTKIDISSKYPNHKNYNLDKLKTILKIK